MAILSVIKMYKENYGCIGSCLRTPSNEVAVDEFGSRWLKRIIQDMFETLYSNPSGVGLAANQVGILKRVCVVDVKRDGKKPIVLINPNYKALNDEQVDSQEVCLSFPEVSSLIKRYKKISVTYQDFFGNANTFEAEGFKANVFQHEIDHLDGVVHVDLAQNAEGIADYQGYSVKLAQIAINNIMKLTKGDADER